MSSVSLLWDRSCVTAYLETSLTSTDQLLWRTSFSLGLSDPSSWGRLEAEDSGYISVFCCCWLVGFWQEYHRSGMPSPGRPRCSVLSLVMLTLITWLQWCLFFEPNSQKPFQRFSQWAVAIRQLLPSALGWGVFKLCLTALERNNLDTLILNFWPPKLWHNTFLLFKKNSSNHVCYCTYELCNYNSNSGGLWNQTNQSHTGCLFKLWHCLMSLAKECFKIESKLKNTNINNSLLKFTNELDRHFNK